MLYFLQYDQERHYRVFC